MLTLLSLLGGFMNGVIALILDGSEQHMYTGLGPIIRFKCSFAKGMANNIEVFTIYGISFNLVRITNYSWIK